MPDIYYMNQFIFTDTKGRIWYLLQREDGSVCLYYMHPGDPAHWVVFDDLDTTPHPYGGAARAAMEGEE